MIESSLLKNSNFLILFMGKLISQLGDVIYNIAIGWYILSITGSATQMSIYMSIGIIVYVIMCPIGGVICDRMDRKSILIWMDLIRGIVVITIGILMHLNVQAIWLFYIAASILSICGALFVPASNSIVPLIVKEKQLAKANSVGASISSLANLVGLVAGGILYALVGIKVIFIINAFSYIFCGLLEIFIKLPKTDRKEFKLKDITFKDFYEDSVAGYRYIRGNKALSIIMWMSTITNIIVFPLFIIFVPYIFNQIAKTSASSYSYVEAAIAIGTMFAAILVSKLPQRDKISGIVTKSILIFSGLVLIMGIFTHLYMIGVINSLVLLVAFIIIFFFIGTVQTIMGINTSVKFQKSAPNEMLGRVTAIMNTLIMVAMPIGTMAGGMAADIIPMNILVFSIGFIILSISLYAIKKNMLAAI